MIVAGNGQHAAMVRGARHVGMAEHVARAVNARPLAIPDAEHAIEAAFAAHLRLLRAPQRGGRQVLVEARLELDVAWFEQRTAPP